MKNKKLGQLFNEAIENIYELLDRAAIYNHESRTYYSLGSEGIASAMRFLVRIGSAELVEDQGPRHLKIKRKPAPGAPQLGSSLQELRNHVWNWSRQNTDSTRPKDGRTE
jgi:hypothetical protein